MVVVVVIVVMVVVMVVIFDHDKMILKLCCIFSERISQEAHKTSIIFNGHSGSKKATDKAKSLLFKIFTKSVTYLPQRQICHQIKAKIFVTTLEEGHGWDFGEIDLYFIFSRDFVWRKNQKYDVWLQPPWKT